MNLAALVRTLILGSIMLLVVSLGLRSTAGDAEYLFRRPRLLAQSLFAMYVVMPLIMIGLVMRLGLRPPVEIALAALALSPVPPFLPSKQLKLASCEGYIYGLLVAASVLSIVLVPAGTAFLATRLMLGPHVRAVLRIVVLTVLLPLAVGMTVRRLWPDRASAWVRPLGALGTALLIVGFLPVLAAQWGAIRSVIGNGTLLAIVVATCIGLFVGHMLGGPDPQHRTVLALATASRHPGVALAIASAGFPDQKLVPAAVLLAVLVGVTASTPYCAWRARVHPASPGQSRRRPV